jgi:ribulose-5-phosphate 4-epimerase/fuculose-1-phosphate aldolase
MTAEFDSEKQARKEVIRVMRIVTAKVLVSSSDGNISLRLGEDHSY